MKRLLILLPLLAVLLAGCSTNQGPKVSSFARVTEIDTDTGEVIASYQVVDGVPVDPEAPGSAMIQSGVTQLMTPEAWYEGWFSFFSPTKKEYAHAQVHNGVVVNLYAQAVKAWRENPLRLAGPDGSEHVVPFGAMPRASDYLVYLYDPQSGSQRFGLNAQSGLAYLGLGGSFYLAGKGMDVAADASKNSNDSALAGANAGSANSLQGVGAGVDAAATGAGLATP